MRTRAQKSCSEYYRNLRGDSSTTELTQYCVSPIRLIIVVRLLPRLKCSGQGRGEEEEQRFLAVGHASLGAHNYCHYATTYYYK